MKISQFVFGRRFTFAGLFVALSMGPLGSCSLRAAPVPQVKIETLDAKAQPHFEEARRNIPAVVQQLSGFGTQCKLCWLMARDKLTGSQKTQDYLASVLKEPIIAPCRRGAKVYGCDFEDAGFLNCLSEVNSDYAAIRGYAVGGLAIEAVFLRQTLVALNNVLGSAAARLALVCGGGAACAAADGPLPFGDVVAVVLAAGGTAWSAYDLWRAHGQLPQELTALLELCIRDCVNACRMEAIR